MSSATYEDIASEEGTEAMLRCLKMGIEPIPNRPGCFRVKGANKHQNGRPYICYNGKDWFTQQLFCYHIQCVDELDGFVMDGRNAAHSCKDCKDCCVHLRPALDSTNKNDDMFCDMYHAFFLCLCSERGADEDDEWAAVTCHVPWDKYSAALMKLMHKHYIEYHLEGLQARFQGLSNDEECREDYARLIEEFGDLSEVTKTLQMALDDLKSDWSTMVDELRAIGRRREGRMGTALNRQIEERFERLVMRGEFRDKYAHGDDESGDTEGGDTEGAEDAKTQQRELELEPETQQEAKDTDDAEDAINL